MGACAGCMGPSRRDENYRVNRLTQNAPIKNRVSSSQLPSYKHKNKIVQQINSQKKRLDQSSLLGLLASSPQVNPSYTKQTRPTSQAMYYREPNQGHYTKQNFQNISLIMPKSIRKVQSTLMNDNSIGMHNSLIFSNDRINPFEGRSPIVSDFKVGSYSRESLKFPLHEIGGNKTSNQVSMVLKKKTLLNIPQIPEQDSKTPFYIKQQKRKNGQDVLKTGLADLPKKLEPAPSANLYRYLKDLQ